MKSQFSKHKSLLIFITTVIMCGFSILGGPLDYAGNWVLPSPTALHSAREHGFDNPMTALISQKPVFLHCDSEDKRNMIITHLKKISKHDIEATEFPDNIWKLEVR